MKIGIFDSGLGGLLITRAIHNTLPQYDTVYLGDTFHVPYGSRSQEAVYDLSRKAVDHLFHQEDCKLIIIACNTASASALRRLQQEYLPNNFPDRRILGVIVPTLETATDMSYKRIGLIATPNIVHSNIYNDELTKINSALEIYSQATPLLVPLIEHNGTKWAEPILEEYLTPLKQKNIESLILGCTHYPHLKPIINRILGGKIELISQDEIIPEKIANYLNRHPEIEQTLSQHSQHVFYVTDLTENYIETAKSVYGSELVLQIAQLSEQKQHSAYAA